MTNYITHVAAVKSVEEGKKVLMHHNGAIICFNDIWKEFSKGVNALHLRAMLDDENATVKDIVNADYSFASRHDLKIHPEYFNEVRIGNKSFEIRKNDRNYKVHDVLILKEFDPIKNDFTGKEIEKIISYITDFQQKK